MFDNCDLTIKYGKRNIARRALYMLNRRILQPDGTFTNGYDFEDTQNYESDHYVKACLQRNNKQKEQQIYGKSEEDEPDTFVPDHQWTGDEASEAGKATESEVSKEEQVSSGQLPPN